MSDATGRNRLLQSSKHQARQIQQLEGQIKGLQTMIESKQAELAEIKASKKITDDSIAALPAPKVEKKPAAAR